MCKAIRANGERCKAIAGSDGLCAIHGGRQDPRELGRKGGRGRTRKQDGAVAASDLGRTRLIELTQSDDPKVAISAARALFSYGPQKPPAEDRAGTQNEAHWWQFARRLEAEGLVRDVRIEREGERTFLTWSPLDVQTSLRNFLDRLWNEGLIRPTPKLLAEVRGELAAAASKSGDDL